MSVDVGISEGTRAISAPAAAVVARISVTSAGAANAVLELDPGQDQQIPGLVGYGPGVDATQRALTIAGRRSILVKAAGSVDGTLSAVTKDGSGPTVTAALEAGVDSPFDSFTIRAKVTKKGANGIAQVRIALNGYTYGPTLDIPALLPAALTGTVDLSSAASAALFGNSGSLDATTVIVGVTTVTLDEPASPAALVTQLVDGGLHAKLVAGKYLQLYSASTGSGATLDVGSGTANALLGFATNPAAVAGVDSIVSVPKTGVKLTFASGTYVLGTTYTVTTTPARMTLDDLDAALDALRASGVRFGIVHVVQDPVDGADLLEFAQALDAKFDAWHNAASDRIFPVWAMGGPLGSTSTDYSGDAANDLDVRQTFAGYTSLYCVAPAHGDMYCTSAEYGGAMRRSLAWPLVETLASIRYSADPGSGMIPNPKLPGCSAIGPDGATKIRDELFAVHKMEEVGFTVATRQANAPKIKAGMTLAGATSKFRFPGVLRMAYAAAEIAYQRALVYENGDLPLETNGALRETIAASIDTAFDADFKRLLVDPGHCSAAKTTIDRSKRAADDGVYPLTPMWTVQMNGQIRDVSGVVSVVSQLSIS